MFSFFACLFACLFVSLLDVASCVVVKGFYCVLLYYEYVECIFSSTIKYVCQIKTTYYTGSSLS